METASRIQPSRWPQIAPFAGIPETALRDIEALAHRRSFAAGAQIFAEGTACAGLHILIKGLVRVHRCNSEGRLHTLNLLSAPATFNEVAAVDGADNPFDATAVTAADALVISHDALLTLLAAHPRLMTNIMQQLARLNREYLERLEDMTFRTIPSRLAKLFLHETIYAETPSPTSLTQEEIASILGTTREVVGRALRSLLNAGLLTKRGRHVYIEDRAGLVYLAETNTMPDSVLRPACPLVNDIETDVHRKT
ncbi:MAG: Crp/Fnr family transcriptional regulator [Anaerolinea sp.]|nr:Crp/Fnr family transcriptional regulator [Anaerolinea sp.]